MTAFLSGRAVCARRRAGQRRRAGPVAVGGRHGAGADAQLRSVQAPTHFKLVDLMKKINRKFGAHEAARRRPRAVPTAVEGTGRADARERRRDRWNFLFIGGMWFQDLFNYDFRRTEMCIIPYATQQGEISFCAYNTGVGWRHIVEKMHMTATLTKWYRSTGATRFSPAASPCRSTDRRIRSR